MTNTEKLKEYIKSSGYKIRFIASKIGLSYQGFQNKLHNKSSFNQLEIIKLCNLLGIEKNERDKIFFDNAVDDLSIL